MNTIKADNLQNPTGTDVMQRIIYLQDNGALAVIIPAPEALAQYGINAIAQKDVPSGRPFKIVDASVIPIDRTQRAAWTVDEADLTDGVGADYETFPEPENDQN